VSASVSPSERSSTGLVQSASSTLRVQAVFRDVDEQQAHTLAAEMIGRAHELANLPDCECDVDVSVQVVPPDEPAAGDGHTR
jgi:hypothetical protein